MVVCGLGNREMLRKLALQNCDRLSVPETSYFGKLQGYVQKML